MKKLISAVTSICMTATMFASVAPASVSALDPTKTFSLRTIGGGNTYTVSADDIAAGDVTIHCGLYMDEATEGEITSFQCLFGIRDTSTGSMDNITMTSLVTDIVDDYYDTAVSYTTSEGTTFSTKKLPFAYAGLNSRGNYSATSTQYNATYSDKKASLGVDLPSIYVAWLTTNSAPQWLGASADEFPVCYFDITLKQGASGSYVISAYDDLYNDSPTNLQPCCNMGSSTVGYEYYSEKQDMGEGIINFEGLTINIEGGESSQTTTTTTTTATTTTTTTTTATTPDVGDEVVLDYLYPDGADCYTVEPGGEVFVDMSIDSKGTSFWGFDVSLLADDGIEITEILTESAAFGANCTANTAKTDRFGNPTSALVNAGFTALKVPETDTSMVGLTVSVPEDTAPGTYYINLSYLYLQLTQAQGEGTEPTYLREGDVIYNAAKIVVEGNGDGTTTTTTTTSSSSSSTTTTTTTSNTTTTTTPAPGERYLGDANCDNVVNVADVVVLNKYLAGNGDLKDQGKINAEVTAPTLKVADVDLTYDDSTYIIESIVHLWTLTDNGPVATEYNGK